MAVDGKIFEGVDAELKCKRYERGLRADKIAENFKKIDIKEVRVPLAVWWHGDDAKCFKVTLKSKYEYTTLLDYFYEFDGVWDDSPKSVMEEPKEYPYTTLIGRGYDWAYEYKIENYKRDLQEMLQELQ